MYLSFGDEWLGLRPADGGSHRYYNVGLEHRQASSDRTVPPIRTSESDALQRVLRRLSRAR